MADAAAALAAQQSPGDAAEQAKADDEQMDGAFAAAAFGGKVEAVFKAADDDEDDDDDEDEIEQESEPEVDKNEELQVALEKNYPYFALTICPADGNHLLIPEADKALDLNWERLAISFAGQLSLQRHLQMGSRRFTIGLDSADGTSLQNISPNTTTHRTGGPPVPKRRFHVQWVHIGFQRGGVCIRKISGSGDVTSRSSPTSLRS